MASKPVESGLTVCGGKTMMQVGTERKEGQSAVFCNWWGSFLSGEKVLRRDAAALWVPYAANASFVIL